MKLYLEINNALNLRFKSKLKGKRQIVEFFNLEAHL